MDTKALLSSWAGLALTAPIVFMLFELSVVFPRHSILITFIAWLLLMPLAYLGSRQFKRTEGDEGMVIYRNHNDVLRCLSALMVPLLLHSLGDFYQRTDIGNGAAWAYFIGITLYICYDSAKLNRIMDLPVVYLVKISTSFVWFLSVFDRHAPSGSFSSDRSYAKRDYKTISMIVIAPLMDMLVLDRKSRRLIEKKFNGRRYAGTAQDVMDRGTWKDK